MTSRPEGMAGGVIGAPDVPEELELNICAVGSGTLGAWFTLRSL